MIVSPSRPPRARATNPSAGSRGAMNRLRHHSACLRRASDASDLAVLTETAEDTRTPVCLVIGAGAGIGQAVARKFAKEGLHACVVRRGGGPSSLSDDRTPELFEQFVQSIKDDGGQATAFFAYVLHTGSTRVPRQTSRLLIDVLTCSI